METAKSKNLVGSKAPLDKLIPAHTWSSKEVSNVVADRQLVKPGFAISLRNSELNARRNIKQTKRSRISQVQGCRRPRGRKTNSSPVPNNPLFTTSFADGKDRSTTTARGGKTQQIRTQLTHRQSDVLTSIADVKSRKLVETRRRRWEDGTSVRNRRSELPTNQRRRITGSSTIRYNESRSNEVKTWGFSLVLKL